jgi:hypothetical protein
MHLYIKMLTVTCISIIMLYLVASYQFSEKQYDWEINIRLDEFGAATRAAKAEIGKMVKPQTMPGYCSQLYSRQWQCLYTALYVKRKLECPLWPCMRLAYILTHFVSVYIVYSKQTMSVTSTEFIPQNWRETSLRNSDYHD